MIEAKQKMSWCSRRGTDPAGSVSEEVRLGGEGEGGVQSSGRVSVQEAVCTENLSSDRLAVSLGKQGSREGHRVGRGHVVEGLYSIGNGYHGRVFKLGDDQMISAL